MRSSKRILASVMAMLILALLLADVSEGYPIKNSGLPAHGHFRANSLMAKTVDNSEAGTRKGAAHPSDEEGRSGKGSYGEKSKKNKYPIIAAMDSRLEKVFGKYGEARWMDWKLWVGFVFWLAVWVRWIFLGDREIYYERAFHAFGINIMILHQLQYSPNPKMGMIGVNSFLALQTLFQTCLELYKHKPEQMEEFECDTLYLDLMLPFEQIVVLFVAQVCVWWFYMTSILNNFNFDHVNYVFWLLAYLTMQMTMIFNRGGDSVLGNPFPVQDVLQMVKNADKVKYTLKDDEEAAPAPFPVSRADIALRGIMGFWCNSILREIMSYTIPLMLMGFSEPMDFVVYCVGVNFICTLDDMSGKTYSMKYSDAPEASDPEEDTPRSDTPAIQGKDKEVTPRPEGRDPRSKRSWRKGGTRDVR